MSIYIKNKNEIEKMRVACQMAADTLLLVDSVICAGMTGDDINFLVHKDTIKKGGTPAPLGYYGHSKVPFPKSVCVSPNEVVCHGVPNNFCFKNGDIVNVDITTIIDGWHGDVNATFFIGTPKEEIKNLVQKTCESLYVGAREIKPNVRLGTIGAKINNYLKENNLSIVKEYTGHGIGKKFHEEPTVCHFGTAGAGIRLQEGMIFTIEPIVTVNPVEHYIDDDCWTVKTIDRSWAAQFEETILVTNDGYEILTKRNKPFKNSINL